MDKFLERYKLSNLSQEKIALDIFKNFEFVV